MKSSCSRCLTANTPVSIEKIAKRQDIGDILAYGVVEASQKIGNGAQEHAYHIKKLEPIPYTIDPYFLDRILAIQSHPGGRSFEADRICGRHPHG